MTETNNTLIKEALSELNIPFVYEQADWFSDFELLLVKVKKNKMSAEIEYDR